LLSENHRSFHLIARKQHFESPIPIESIGQSSLSLLQALQNGPMPHLAAAGFLETRKFFCEFSFV